VTAPGSAFARELEQSQAAETARAGNYAEAVRLLERTGDDDPATLDLLARVHAQRGDLAAAETAWRRLLAVHPTDPSATAGVRLIADITSGRRRMRPVQVRTLSVAAVVLVALAVGVLSTLDSRQNSPSATAGIVRHGPSSSVRASPTVAPDPPRAQLTGLMTALAGPDVRLELHSQDVEVDFDDGLFNANSSQLSVAGRQTVTRWSQLLRGEKVRVTVLGHTIAVDGGPQNGGSTMGIARASAAAETLATGSGLPPTAFTIVAADQTSAPYPTTSADGRARDRTVSLLVTPVP
jgi:outer membrane protein OmpA-like peptidoglycan-associated protein